MAFVKTVDNYIVLIIHIGTPIKMVRTIRTIISIIFSSLSVIGTPEEDELLFREAEAPAIITATKSGGIYFIVRLIFLDYF